MRALRTSSHVAGSASAAPDTARARSRRLHEAFETYYAERERRRLTDEAVARHSASRIVGGWYPRGP
jgi:hypothetical protein